MEQECGASNCNGCLSLQCKYAGHADQLTNMGTLNRAWAFVNGHLQAPVMLTSSNEEDEASLVNILQHLCGPLIFI